MFGFDPLSMATLLVLAAGQPACTAPQPAAIKVTPHTAEVKIRHDKTLGELQAYQSNTINLHSFSGASYMEGFMEGAIHITPAVKLGYTQNKRSGDVCLYYETITVDISIDPAIHIAREVYDDQCMRKAALDHEMKHVMTDRALVNKYAGIMGKKLYEGLAARGFTAGPLPPDIAEDTAGRMHKTVSQILELEYKRMELDRAEAQGAVDSIEEYDRVDAQCPDFKAMPESLKAYYASKKRQ
ncbi:MAG: hypothetical protein LRY54_01225 [Alphaproteobacteria bacterium]|nr:hypothetical protein [Alphaproteobacteria bacterium]